MTKRETLEKITNSFKRYYNIRWEDVLTPFVAEAEFHSHDEGYFLMKSAKLFESTSNEYVFFMEEEQLSLDRLKELDAIAWEAGLARTNPCEGHRNTDVALIIVADTIDADAFSAVAKMKHYKSYRMSLRGWNQYRLVALELSTGKVAYNRLGRNLEKLFSNIF